MSRIRLDRYLADVHLGSRKQIRELIRDGRVRVNGETVNRTDHHVDTETDVVSFDDRTLTYFKNRYLMLNKPSGTVSATRDGLSKTVIDLLKGIPVRGLFPVGRLDKDTEGLLLITDDGALAHALLSPAYAIRKTYEVHAAKPFTQEMLAALKTGVDIGDEKPTLPAEAAVLPADETVLMLTIREGRFHQVKRMMHAVGNECVFLKRTGFATLSLEAGLKPGAYRNLSAEEINLLKDSCGTKKAAADETDA